jgi:toxin ParE1/3/4
MRRRKVVFSPEAQRDLLTLYDFIAEKSGPNRALAYVTRIEEYCGGFELIGERGARRDDLRPGLRVVGFKGSATIAFHVDADTVTIDRVFYRGRDVERALDPSAPRRR